MIYCSLKVPRPFLGWLMLVEDAPSSMIKVRDTSPVFSESQGAPYLDRDNVLCEKLVKVQPDTIATCVTSSRKVGLNTGVYAELSEMTSIKTFVSSFAAHIAATAAMV